MTVEEQQARDDYDGDDDNGGVDGIFILPSTKVRLPDHVTKLRKRSRRPNPGSDANANERES